jgi:hypothetical protein
VAKHSTSVKKRRPIRTAERRAATKPGNAMKTKRNPEKTAARVAVAPRAPIKHRTAGKPIQIKPAPHRHPTKAMSAPKEPAKPTVRAGITAARSPLGAEELKARLGALAAAIGQIRALKRSFNKSFYDVGGILREIQVKKLYEVKGYSSFETFLEREIDLGRQTSLRIVRIAQTFVKEAAVAAGLDRLSAALDALDGAVEQAPQPTSPGTTATGSRSPIPLHKQ